jgi:capsular polysaccharide transport system permease protein
MPAAVDHRGVEQPWQDAAFNRLKGILKRNALLTLTVVVPVVFATIYYGLIASDIYVSEAHFIVRSRATSGSSMMSGISDTSVLQPLSSMSASNDDTQAVDNYFASRDVMERLIREVNLLEFLSRPEADFVARFPRFWSKGSHEGLFQRFDDFVYPYFDPGTGISTLYVYAFRPEDARRIALAALNYGEELVNRVNDRARNDTIAFAKQMVAEAEERVRRQQQLITDFRKREAIFDPVRQGAAVIELIAKMNAEVADLRAELEEVSANSPSSPKIPATKARIRALEKQIEEERPLLAGGDKSLAPKVAEYEKLTLELELGVKLFASSLLTLEGAIKDTEQQRLYLERVVEPNLPDFPLYPKRIVSILKVLGFSACIFWILKLLGDIVWEHDS